MVTKIGDIKDMLKEEVPSYIDIDTIEIEISADEKWNLGYTKDNIR